MGIVLKSGDRGSGSGATYKYLISIVNIPALLQSVAAPQTFVIFRHFGLDIISSAT
ncbi:hypothetical protein [Mesorhizobium sp. WSM4884]|uniref:hypothetical protein n=1 Tax=Mesorhizobium sp. WSM4884 TaxID=3038542 RepID=UPI002415FBF1|nr:hypothetical protein [Mesorhizobium sp. WSM4884]MDG4880883.1 hypothetical protein [Mesorhizobium sp. WSM4884]